MIDDKELLGNWKQSLYFIWQRIYSAIMYEFVLLFKECIGALYLGYYNVSTKRVFQWNLIIQQNNSICKDIQYLICMGVTTVMPQCIGWLRHTSLT